MNPASLMEEVYG